MKRIPIQKKLLSLLPLLFLFLILLFPTQARNGASSGLLLWFNVLLPTLLPFMILSDLIRRLHIIDTLCNRIASRTGRNLYFLYPLLLGLLCGLPLGAKLTAEAVRSGQLSRKQGQFLLTVCNNSSTMFLMGYVADVQLQRPELISCFILLVPLSSLLAAILQAMFSTLFTSICTHFSVCTSAPLHSHSSGKLQHRSFAPYLRLTPPSIVAHALRTSPAKTDTPPSTSATSPADTTFISSASSSIMDSFAVITQVGGFVILFSVLAEFALLIDSPLTLPLVAALEITIGIRVVCASALSETAKAILSAAAVSFTGISGIAQTACMLSGTGLSLIRYIFSRLLSAVFVSLFFFLFL